MSVSFGQFGGDNAERPFVTMDGLDYPLVPESIVEGSPLNPFSPSNADGNTTAVVSQRHATEVWDDLTGGLGYRDDEPGSHQYAAGTLDVRVPGGWVPPPLLGGFASGTAGSIPNASLITRTQYFSDDNGNDCFLVWQDSGSGHYMRRVVGATASTVGLVDTEVCRGVAQWNGNTYALTAPSAGSAALWRSAAVPTALSFTLALNEATTVRYGLVAYDNKLICYNATAGTFEQWSGSAWVAYIPGYAPLPNGEVPMQLVVWSDKSGSRDALYALTGRRIIVYDEDGQQWEKLYYFGDLFGNSRGFLHVNRRDNSLVLMPFNPASPTYGNILVFTPGTADNIAINKGYAFPPLSGTSASAVSFPVGVASGIHWLFAACYNGTSNGPGDGLGAISTTYGAVYAYNEFGGWTCLAPTYTNAAQLVGLGYGGGKLLTIHGNGTFLITSVPDMQLDAPQGSYDSQALGSGHTHWLRSGRIFNKQRNIKKLGSHVEVTLRAPLVSGTGVSLRWRYFNENGLSTWRTSSGFPAGVQRVSVNLTDGSGSNGIQYYYMEWELNVYMPTGSATPPIIESVVLNYTYYQTNRYAYSFNVDLTAETWAEFYMDGTFHGKSREYLQQQLLAMLDKTAYHTFSYSQLYFTESVTRADMTMARRESSDDASGIYSLTVRDLEPDVANGSFVVL